MKRTTIIVLVLWLSAVGMSVSWNLADEKMGRERLAFDVARAFFQQVVGSRAWNAGHGGVYVPVSETVKPNPYLEIPNRDVTTTGGLELTRINPAFMTREISEITSKDKGNVQFHLTSLTPIRPENKAEAWEKEWLESFETGVPERGEFVEDGTQLGFRYMAPLMVKESCMACHAKQGYQVGDVRGGISVTLPHFEKWDYHVLAVGYGIAALLGAALILVGGRLLEKKQLLLVKANESLRGEKEELRQAIEALETSKDQVKELSGIVPICSYCKGIRDDKGYWNQIETYISEHSDAEFSHGICETCMSELYPNVKSKKSD